jgi:hypothetical protein
MSKPSYRSSDNRDLKPILILSRAECRDVTINAGVDATQAA